MDEKFLIDTNIIIYYLDNRIPESELDRIEEIMENSFNISTVTNIEVLGWHRITDVDRLKISEFLSIAKIYYIDYDIQKKAIEIKQNFKIATPDAIIGATALLNNFTLVTRNEKDFKRIEGLMIYNPFGD